MWQRDARICTAKAGFFRSGDNSPSSGHVTRRSLLCHLYCDSPPAFACDLQPVFCAPNALFFLEIHKVFHRKTAFFRAKISG